MCSIKIGVVGYILEGYGAGCYVKVLDDSINSGGYLILRSPDDTFYTGFDDWLEKYSDLPQYFEENNWKVRWIN